MYKEDLSLNNLQGLICHKTQTNTMLEVWTIIDHFKKVTEGYPT